MRPECRPSASTRRSPSSDYKRRPLPRHTVSLAIRPHSPVESFVSKALYIPCHGRLPPPSVAFIVEGCAIHGSRWPRFPRRHAGTTAGAPPLPPFRDAPKARTDSLNFNVTSRISSMTSSSPPTSRPLPRRVPQLRRTPILSEKLSAAAVLTSYLPELVYVQRVDHFSRFFLSYIDHINLYTSRHFVYPVRIIFNHGCLLEFAIHSMFHLD
ncbi:hypothetical protein BRADI_5g00252v3 [Brachypodium distachyon]|uniref:Uncharacterized protein n=1 Tax=Brachypodium distachyon TaxID=15368 RepID=A0A2K2CEL4_BRADI|nr:hypothetical protein BRADI_5g00252v3 [Brachypodium distachyon]